MENIDLNNEKEEKNENEKLIDRMVEKSIEAVLLAIELYNKPTIKYRSESFTMLISNAWELILKANLMLKDGEESIYIKNDKSISLKTAVRKTFKSNSPIYENLMELIDFRNIATHHIIREFDYKYFSIFQASINNYSSFILKNFNVDINEKIESSLLILLKPKHKNISEINYDSKTFKLYDEISNKLDTKIHRINASAYSSTVYINIKKESDIKLDKNSTVVTHVQSMDELYPFSQKIAIQKINLYLKSHNINYTLNQNALTVINEEFKLKTNIEYYYEIKNPNGSKNSIFRCNQDLVDYVVKLIYNNPEIVNEIRAKRKASKKGE